MELKMNELMGGLLSNSLIENTSLIHFLSFLSKTTDDGVYHSV